MAKMKKYNNGGGLRQALTGIDIDGGGLDTFKDNPIASMIPGGGLDEFGRPIAPLEWRVACSYRRAAQQDMARARKDAQKARRQIQRSRADLDAFEFDISQAQRDLATAGIRPTDFIAYAGNASHRACSFVYRPQGAANISGLLRQTQQATLAAQQADLQRGSLGLCEVLADLEQTALERKQGLQLGLLEEDRAMALADRATAQTKY